MTTTLTMTMMCCCRYAEVVKTRHNTGSTTPMMKMSMMIMMVTLLTNCIAAFQVVSKPVVNVQYTRTSLMKTMAMTRKQPLTILQQQKQQPIDHEDMQQTHDDDDTSSSTATGEKKKRIVFIRHGRTYMNDFINGVNYGTPGFTDIFPKTEENEYKYYDSPLSPTGIRQVKKLNQQIHDYLIASTNDGDNADDNADDYDDTNLVSIPESEDTATSATTSFLDDLDLIVVSPLTRALQTMDMGLYQPLKRHSEQIQEGMVPVIAVPYAAERIYLISDHGKTKRELKKVYPYVDFATGFDDTGENADEDGYWHYIPTKDEIENYVEWRPHGQGQVYSCVGESQNHFDGRMMKLYSWLQRRTETTIVVVCHAGVIEWFCDEIVDNCEIRIIDFDKLLSSFNNKEKKKNGNTSTSSTENKNNEKKPDVLSA